jgi:hypothetical protein
MRFADAAVALEDVVVGRHGARDRRLAEADDDLDHHAIAALAHRIAGEEDAGDIRVDHALDDDGHAQVAQRPLLGPVEQGPLGEERGPAVTDPSTHLIAAANVEERLLLAREARGFGVLRGGAGPHGDRHVSCSEGGVGAEHRLTQGRVELDGADQRLRRPCVLAFREAAQLRPAVRQCVRERVGGDDESRRHR